MIRLVACLGPGLSLTFPMYGAGLTGTCSTTQHNRPIVGTDFQYSKLEF